MPLALFGVLGLAAVVLIHELAEVVVIANGVRAGRTKALAITAARSSSAPIPLRWARRADHRSRLLLLTKLAASRPGSRRRLTTSRVCQFSAVLCCYGWTVMV